MDALEQQVYNILLTPIECITNSEYKIFLKDNVVYTSQSYICDSGIKNYDQDMSDFSLGFYNILYKDILCGMSILKGDGRMHCDQFAGDTINSFNSIANCTPNAGKSIKCRTPKKEWPSYLQQYEVEYHCLANFWIIPCNVGRKGKKLNHYDSMDLFLLKIKESKSVLPSYKCYSERVDDFETFCKCNFIPEGRKEEEIRSEYKEMKSEILIGYAMDDIKERARKISTSQYKEKLWEYFDSLCLFK